MRGRNFDDVGNSYASANAAMASMLLGMLGSQAQESDDWSPGGRKVIFCGRSSLWILFWYFLLIVIVAPVSPAIAAILFLLTMGYVVTILTTKYYIDNERIIIYRGILIRTMNSFELFRIKSLEIKKDWWLLPLGIGTITFTSADYNGSIVRIGGLRNIDYIAMQLLPIIKRQRRTNNVITIDNI